MKITCLIVDDEQVALDGLALLCSKYEHLEIVGFCKNGLEAIDRIGELKPDLVLLDIQMPKVNGIEVLASLERPLPKVIFVTAYDQFAIKAFEINAIDYLLKPFTDERFDLAMSRAIDQILANKATSFDQLIKTHEKPGIDNPDVREQDEHRIVIKADGRIHMIPKSDIIIFEAYDYYVKIHTQERYYLVRETLKNLEGQLSPDLFMRTHKSYIVHKIFVKTLVKQTGGIYILELSGDLKAKISRTRLNVVEDWLT